MKGFGQPQLAMMLRLVDVKISQCRARKSKTEALNGGPYIAAAAGRFAETACLRWDKIRRPLTVKRYSARRA